MIIRTAILCIPTIDEQAVLAIRRLLQNGVPNLYIVREEGVDSQRHWLEELLRRLCDEEELDLILTIGGTLPAPGPSAKEIAPEATSAIVERFLPGFSEAMRQYAGHETPMAYLDRGVAGIRGRTLIVNLPAGVAPAYLFLEAIVDLLGATVLHLNEHATAPQLADLLEMEEMTAIGEVDQTGTSAPTHAPRADVAKKPLDPAEFADFLKRRNKPNEQE